jgi:TolB-like protein
MSADPEQEFFADGITEDIITALSKSRSLFVIARNSTFTYKGKSVAVKDIGRELGVRYVLEGSVRKAGNRVRVTAQLVEAATAASRRPRALDRRVPQGGVGRLNPSFSAACAWYTRVASWGAGACLASSS